MSNVYLIRKKGSDFYKIGYTSDLSTRLSRLQTGCPETLELVASIKKEEAKQFESELHSKFSKNKTRGEWFEFAPWDLPSVLECFDRQFNHTAEFVEQIMQTFEEIISKNDEKWVKRFEKHTKDIFDKYYALPKDITLWNIEDDGYVTCTTTKSLLREYQNSIKAKNHANQA